jgi:hypothetical protein
MLAENQMIATPRLVPPLPHRFEELLLQDCIEKQKTSEKERL